MFKKMNSTRTISFNRPSQTAEGHHAVVGTGKNQEICFYHVMQNRLLFLPIGTVLPGFPDRRNNLCKSGLNPSEESIL